MSLSQRRGMVDREHLSLSIAQRCALLEMARSSLYYRPREAPGEDLALMRETYGQSLDTPCRGSRRMKAWLARGHVREPEGVQRLMHIMGLRAIYRSPPTSRRRNIGSTLICCGMPRSPEPTRRVPPTASTCPWPGGFLPKLKPRWDVHLSGDDDQLGLSP